jgi:flagellar hook assembly protein FlgD
MDAGAISLGWDGRNEAGNASASGVYFVKVRAGTSRATTKLVLVR